MKSLYKIKSLEWVDGYDNVIYYDYFGTSQVLTGSYRIFKVKIGKYYNWHFCDPDYQILDFGKADSLEEAKETCRRHWEEQLKEVLLEMKSKDEILNDFAEKLIKSQKNIPEEFLEVFNKNFWDLI